MDIEKIEAEKHKKKWWEKLRDLIEDFGVNINKIFKIPNGSHYVFLALLGVLTILTGVIMDLITNTVITCNFLSLTISHRQTRNNEFR